eukprot:1005596-Rhodomonas_salina.1
MEEAAKAVSSTLKRIDKLVKYFTPPPENSSEVFAHTLLKHAGHRYADLVWFCGIGYAQADTPIRYGTVVLSTRRLIRQCMVWYDCCGTKLLVPGTLRLITPSSPSYAPATVAASTLHTTAT